MKDLRKDSCTHSIMAYCDACKPEPIHIPKRIRLARALTAAFKYRPDYVEGDMEYPQTWSLVVTHIPHKLHPIIQFLCGITVGHELSKTESGWGCGNLCADKWCRWCNKHFEVPLVACDLTDEWGDIVKEYSECERVK